MRPLPLRIGLALLLTAASAVPAAAWAREDARGALERLASTRAEEREAAQDWLAVHLVPGDLIAVAEAARRGDAETRGRLVRALASDGKHLALVVRLCDGTGGEERALGRSALEALVRAWLPGLTEPLLDADAVRDAGRESAGELWTLEARRETFAERFERVARRTDLAPPLVLTPELLAEDAPALRPALSGTAAQLLHATVVGEGLSLAGVRVRAAESDAQQETVGGDRPALLVVDRRGRALRKTALERVEEWCLAVHRGERSATGAARALAQSGWPAAIAWMERIALDGTEGPRREAALEGLAAAARRGLVAPALATERLRRTLLERAEERLASDDEALRGSGSGFARALAELGSRTPDGVERADLLLPAGDERLTDASLWARLVALEGQHPGDPRARTFVVDAVTDAERPALVRLQALRALAALGGGADEVLRGRIRRAFADSRALRRLRGAASGCGGDDTLLDLLGAVAGPPDEALVAAATPDADPSFAPLVARWALRTGAVERAAELLERAAAALGPDGRWPQAWVDVARDARRRSGREVARAVLGAALPDADSDRARSLWARADLAEAGEQARWATELAERESLDPRELRTLGALAAGPRSATVRERLASEVGSATAPRAREVLGACLAAADALLAARRDLERNRLRLALWNAVRDPEHPLHEALGPRSFPPELRPAGRPLAPWIRRLD